MYQRWLKSGGANAAMVAIDRDYINQNIIKLEQPGALNRVKNVVKSPLEALRILSELSENATRVGEFARAIDKGQGQLRGRLRRARSDARLRPHGRADPCAQCDHLRSGTRRSRAPTARRGAFKAHPFSTTLKVMASITLPSILLWLGQPRGRSLEGAAALAARSVLDHPDRQVGAAPASRATTATCAMRPTTMSAARQAHLHAQGERQVGDQQRHGVAHPEAVRARHPVRLDPGALARCLLRPTCRTPSRTLAKSVQGALLPNFIPQAATPMLGTLGQPQRSSSSARWCRSISKTSARSSRRRRTPPRPRS
jgi:hypothetical protein